MAPVNTLIIPNDGAISDLDSWRSVLNAGTVRLYDNNYTPVHTSVPGDFNEASFAGYAPVSSPGFAAAFLNGALKAETDSASLNWTYTAGIGTATVYGLYLLDAGGTVVLAATKFGSPVTLSPGQPILARVLQITAVSEI